MRISIWQQIGLVLFIAAVSFMVTLPGKLNATEMAAIEEDAHEVVKEPSTFQGAFVCKPRPTVGPSPEVLNLDVSAEGDLWRVSGLPNELRVFNEVGVPCINGRKSQVKAGFLARQYGTCATEGVKYASTHLENRRGINIVRKIEWQQIDGSSVWAVKLTARGSEAGRLYDWSYTYDCQR